MNAQKKWMFGVLTATLVTMHCSYADGTSKELQDLNQKLQAEMQKMQKEQEKQITSLNQQLQKEMKQVQTNLERGIQTVNTQMKKIQADLQNQMNALQAGKTR